MNARAVECRAAAAQCENKLAKVRVLLTTKSKTQKMTKNRRPRKAFIEAGKAQEVYEDHVEDDDCEYFPNNFDIEYKLLGVIAKNELQEIDGSKVKTEKIESEKLCQVNENIVDKLRDISADEKQCDVRMKMDTVDENKTLKLQLISTCEDKVARLKALLSGRRKKKLSTYDSSQTDSNSNLDSELTEQVTAVKDNAEMKVTYSNILNDNSVSVQASDGVASNLLNDKDQVDNGVNEVLNNEVVTNSIECELDNLILTQEGSPDSCYASNDVLTEVPTESEFDSDSDSGRGRSNLISCLNFTRTVNDLTDESLYDDNTLTRDRRLYSDSDDDLECSLCTICEDDVMLEKLVPELVSMLVSTARKLEKKLLPSKKVYMFYRACYV